MPRTPKIEHGKRTTYVRGCRCDRCKQANTEYGQNLKARRRKGEKIQPPLASVTNITPVAQDPPEPGRVEAQVAKEIEGLSAAAKHPGLVASILAMAKILDNTALATTQPSAQRRLEAGLDKLHGASVGRKGKLAAVAAMTRRSDSGDKAVNDDD